MMKPFTKISHFFILSLFFLILSISSFAQIQKVFVEKYYISDALDATDTIGGLLEAGSTTYRVYVDLFPGSKIKKIYGDANHMLKFASTSMFFNNISEGQTFAKDITKSRLGENTVALDSWLTIGLVTKPSSKVMGVPKIYDGSGSFVGGLNNDGGSANIPGGLLTNTDPLAGIPLTVSDGNDTLSVPIGSWFDYGFLSSNSDDSTIFGSLVQDTILECNNCGLQYSGISGVNPDSNFVLVAQLTTKGDLSFELNLEIIDTTGSVIKYVANDNVLLTDEKLSRYLKYPFTEICGCGDSNYLEYLADRDCDNQDSCKNIIVFGCMDPMSCNYDINANVNIPSLCCYPGKCNDRDLALVCPQLVVTRDADFDFYPNPVKDILNVTSKDKSSSAKYIVYNAVGQKMMDGGIADSENSFQINASDFDSGIYFVRIFNDTMSSYNTFIKE